MGIGHGPIVCRHDARDDITMLFFFLKKCNLWKASKTNINIFQKNEATK